MYEVLDKDTIEMEIIPYIPGIYTEGSKSLFSVFADKGIMANVAYNKRNGTRDQCHILDGQLYKERYVIERTNARMDGFRSVLNRFDTTCSSWMEFNFLAFIVIGKFIKIKKSG